ncbi:unnamed protein product [Ascophyllum nodosum]
MQWFKPADAVLCEVCDSQFSTRWCTRDAKPYCDNCFYNRHFGGQPTVGELTYKELDGAVPGSRDLITYDSIHDLPDIPVEVWDMSANPAETSEISDPSVKGYSEGSSPAPGGAVGEKRFEARAVSEEVSEYLQSQGLFSYETGSPVEDMSSLYAQEWDGGWKQNEDCIP